MAAAASARGQLTVGVDFAGLTRPYDSYRRTDIDYRTVLLPYSTLTEHKVGLAQEYGVFDHKWYACLFVGQNLAQNWQLTSRLRFNLQRHRDTRTEGQIPYEANSYFLYADVGLARWWEANGRMDVGLGARIGYGGERLHIQTGSLTYVTIINTRSEYVNGRGGKRETYLVAGLSGLARLNLTQRIAVLYELSIDYNRSIGFNRIDMWGLYEVNGREVERPETHPAETLFFDFATQSIHMTYLSALAVVYRFGQPD